MDRELQPRIVAGSPPSADRMSLTQTRALAWRALTGAESYREIAEHAGVDESTVRYWLRENARFRELWDQATRDGDGIVNALRTAGRIKSLSTLIDAQSEAEQWSVRVDAATKLLTADRQDRQLETAPARMALGALLEKWGRESEAMLGDGEMGERGGEGVSVVEGEARVMEDGQG
jgi:hypothetical protein